MMSCVAGSYAIQYSPDDLSGDCIADVDDGVELGGPLLELFLPGGHGGQGHAHQHWALERVVVPQILKQIKMLRKKTLCR